MSAVLDIELVRTFHTVARSGRFKAAAELLHKSPAAISTQVQKLEAVAGGRLFERDNQSVALTALGRRLLATTADLLSTHDRVLAELHGTRLAGRIRLGVPDEYAAHVIRDILPVFTAAWPNVVLEVRTSPSYTLRDQVQRGKLQAALVAQPQRRPRQGPEGVATTIPVWVGAATARIGSADPLPLALYAADCPYRDAMLESLSRSGRRWRVVLDSPSSQAVQACVEAGLAVSLIDRVRVTADMQILDGLPAIPPHEVVFLRSASSRTDEAVDLLAEAMHRHFRL
ncbi:LysR family transcriptional regulator [Cupriavidus sp. AU9028]|uniref:LysR family transcriptional regulator n=1 Tax=Cupriavidus sp. AU9028 TaxID=2871157 RepID=UPI001C984736|nr:LysR family transcriptional regulator [Cupriavidus sp. AU9028]MBY4897155.1 LysR family transcriptional regulator [Cupriavidus sp. AU9028]